MSSLSAELASLLHALVERTRTGATNVGASEDHQSNRSPAWQEVLARVTRAWLGCAGPLVDLLQREMVPREEKRHQSEMACKHRAADQDCDVTGATEEKELVRSNLMGESKAPEEEEGWSRSSGNIERSLYKSSRTPRGGAVLGAVSMDNLDRLVAALCLLGGQFGGLHPGAKVLCRIPSKNTVSGADNRPGTQAFGSQGRNGVKNTVAEATVLRLRLSCTRPQGASLSETDNESGIGPTEAPMRRGRVDGAVRRSVQEPRPVFSSRLRAMPSPGSVRPLDVYDGLAQEAYSGVVPPAAVARETVDDSQSWLQQQQQQRQMRQQQRHNQQQHDMSVRTPTAGPGSMFGGQGRELAGMRRRSSSPDVGEAVGVPPIAPAYVRSPVSSAAGQQVTTGRGEWVTVGMAPEDGRSSPRVVTVPIENVTPVRMRTPAALAKALMPHVQDFLPGLRALLEGDTKYGGV